MGEHIDKIIKSSSSELSLLDGLFTREDTRAVAKCAHDEGFKNKPTEERETMKNPERYLHKGEVGGASVRLTNAAVTPHEWNCWANEVKAKCSDLVAKELEKLSALSETRKERYIDHLEKLVKGLGGEL